MKHSMKDSTSKGFFISQKKNSKEAEQQQKQFPSPESLGAL